MPFLRRDFGSLLSPKIPLLLCPAMLVHSFVICVFPSSHVWQGTRGFARQHASTNKVFKQNLEIEVKKKTLVDMH